MKNKRTWVQRRWKAVVALIGFAATVADAFGPQNKWAALIIAVAGVVGVHQVKNAPKS